MKAIMLKTNYKSFHGMIKSSNNMVPVFFDIVSSSDKWINLAQPDGDNKTFKKTCYSNQFFWHSYNFQHFRIILYNND